jgi:hypothetical protein
MHALTLRRHSPTPRVTVAAQAKARAPLAERAVGALVDAFDLIGRELGGAVLMQQHWLGAAATTPTPTHFSGDDA